MARRIKAAGVNVSLSPATYAIRDFESQGLTGGIRVSPHIYTDDTDLQALVTAVRNLT